MDYTRNTKAIVDLAIKWGKLNENNLLRFESTFEDITIHSEPFGHCVYEIYVNGDFVLEMRHYSTTEEIASAIQFILDYINN